MSRESVTFYVDNLGTMQSVKEIKRGLDRLPGVLSVSVSRSSSRLAVDYDSTGVQQERIKRTLNELGYDVSLAGQDHPRP